MGKNTGKDKLLSKNSNMTHNTTQVTESYQPIGVLRYNDEIRYQLLTTHGGRYSQYKEAFKHPIGVTADISTREVTSLTDNESLYSYTHSGDNSYSNDINRNNFGNVLIKSVYTNRNTTGRNRMRWNGEYDNYVHYIDSIFGVDYSIAAYMNTLLSDTSINYFFNLSKPNIVRDLRINDAMGGRITTNSYGGRDETRLGVLSNKLYSTSLYRGAVVNSSRNRGKINKDGEDFGYGYITPILYKKYGNNLNNYNTMSGNFVVKGEKGRLSDSWLSDENNNEIGKIVHVYAELSENDNGGKVYLDEQLKQAEKEFKQIVSIKKPYIVYTNKRLKDIQVPTKGTKTEKKSFDIPGRFVFNAVPKKQFNTDPRAETINNILNNTGTTDGFVFDGIIDDKTAVPTVKLGKNNIKEYFVYQEGVQESRQDISWGVYNSNTTSLGKNNLLAKTNQMFKESKIDTMIGRFHIKVGDSCTTDTAVNETYGNPHGRGLLKAKHKGEKTHGVDNPYCRSWTYHHQYNTMSKLIRPFEDQSIEDIQKKNKRFRSNNSKYNIADGSTYLSKHTVLGESGRVTIAPSVNDTKKCMFSIENLAWKDVLVRQNLSSDHIGPNGGRIMWFPPYDIDFQENVNVNWQSNSFIGRGEDVYTYTNTTRSGQLSFTLLIDHPAIINTISNDNQGEEVDNNILRFFAGCQTLDPDDVDNKKDKKVSTNTEPQKTPNDGPYIIVYCYFPNNYTGNGTYQQKYANWNSVVSQSNLGCTDDGETKWYNYLLAGYNAQLLPDKDKYNDIGYEMINNDNDKMYGISIDHDRYTILACNDKSKNFGKWKQCNTENRDKKYYYRVDFDFREPGIDISKSNKNQTYPNNFQDTYSLGLNYDPQVVHDKMYLKDQLTVNTNLFSFYQLMKSLDISDLRESSYINRQNDGENNHTNDNIEKVNDGIKKLKELFRSKKFYKMRSYGLATSQGSTKQQEGGNDTRSTRRAYTFGKTVVHFLREKNLLTHDFTEYYNTQIHEVGTTPLVNDDNVKIGRSAFILLYYDKPETSNTTSNNNQPANTPQQPTMQQVVYTTNNDGNSRYETEYEYFKNVEKKDPVIFKRIADKIKYFDPAFHSMSPEGFNARLTFLHQCTRQGHTVSATDTKGQAMTAGNLAFGRMPVCVLRLGDFINTRIIIESLNISYNNGGMQWDLNPEGAGVQPMFAKVSMGIKILGGQSLDAPISRLQNAVSFNYYANAGVYDDRADRAKYTDGNSVSYESVYIPDKGMGNDLDNVTVTASSKNDYKNKSKKQTPKGERHCIGITLRDYLTSDLINNNDNKTALCLIEFYMSTHEWINQTINFEKSQLIFVNWLQRHQWNGITDDCEITFNDKKYNVNIERRKVEWRNDNIVNNTSNKNVTIDNINVNLKVFVEDKINNNIGDASFLFTVNSFENLFINSLSYRKSRKPSNKTKMEKQQPTLYKTNYDVKIIFNSNNDGDTVYEITYRRENK